MGLFIKKNSAPRCAEADRYFDCGDLLRLLDVCPHDYRTRSLLVDRLYLLLLYRDFFPLRDRASLTALLTESIDFFARLPRVRAVPRLDYLRAVHRIYLGNLAFCGGDMAEALAQYSAVLKLRHFRGAGEDARLNKEDAADWQELLPLLYNISQTFNLLGLCDRSRALYSRYGDLVYLRRRALETAPSTDEARAELDYLANPCAVQALLLHPVRFDLRESGRPAYDFCCEERYSPALGKTCWRFHSGLVGGAQQAAITLSEQAGEETFAVAFCSPAYSRKKLMTEQTARVAVSYNNDSGKEKAR